jgi:hypothetical protein
MVVTVSAPDGEFSIEGSPSTDLRPFLRYSISEIVNINEPKFIVNKKKTLT